ncbi:hypothetical protein CRE_05809 [Caenorhabditis remanei]|uniref:Uncharacterized protein n=1 Tax=Caenorhabditis remanei TaxID=31234 RepID=E3M081_CAERE|nr:hypothetical protein CRE_05809 [Caenorhabditis remanei]
MVAEIIISMDMITCFKSCVRQQNYKPFFDKYRSYLYQSLDYLNSVYFENADTIFIAQNWRYILRYLETFDSRYPGSFVKGQYGLPSSGIYEDMKTAILEMNWDPFFLKYIRTIDFIIEEARKQQIIHIYIAHDDCCNPNFESRSMLPNFVSTSTTSTGILGTSPPRLYDNSKRGHPYEVKNSGEMLVPNIFTISNFQNISSLRGRYLPPDVSNHYQNHHVSSFVKNDSINERGAFHSPSRESTDRIRQHSRTESQSKPKTTTDGQILSFSSLSEPCCDCNKQQSNHCKQTTELSLCQTGASGYSSNCRAFYSTKPAFTPCTCSECHSKSMLSTNYNDCESITRKVGNTPYSDNSRDKESKLISSSDCSSTRKEAHRLEHNEISPINQAYYTMASETTPRVGYKNPVSLKKDYLNNDHRSTQNQSEFDVIQEKNSMAEEQKTTTQGLETIGSIENVTVPEHIEHLNSVSRNSKNEQFSPAGLLCIPESLIRLHSETGGTDDHSKQITKDSTPQIAFEGAELIKLPLEQSEMVLENSEESPKPVLDSLSHNDGFTMITGAYSSNGFPNEPAYEEHNLSHFEHSDSLPKEEQLLPNQDSEHFHDKLFDSLRRHSLTEKQICELSLLFTGNGIFLISADHLYDNDFFSYKMEIQNASEIERGNEIWEATGSTENDTSHILGDASFHAELEDDNSSFIKYFEEIQSKQREELEEKRSERSKKQQNLEDEVRELREESKKRFQILMNCIALRRHFEEQEDNWKIWIQNCRNHIVSLHRFFSIFEQDYGTILRNSKKLDSDDLKDLQSEKLRVSSFVFKTFYELEEDFEQLKELEHHCQEVIFLRILQKCVADVANKLLEIIELLVQQEIDRDIFMRLEESIANLMSADLIYSTKKLRELCKTEERSENFQNVQFPKLKSHVHVEEVF